jgi:hypothetical protein
MAGPTALHLLLVHLRPAVAAGQRDALVEGLTPLRSLNGVVHIGCVEGKEGVSTHDLGLFVYLRDAAALERFGTHPLLMKYLQQSFLPVVEDFVSMDVAVEGGPAERYGAALCFCLDFRSDTYDWQVRSVLEQLAGDTDKGTLLGASVGVALNQRQPFRAGGLVFAASPNDLSAVRLPPLNADAAAGLAAVAGPALPLP